MNFGPLRDTVTKVAGFLERSFALNISAQQYTLTREFLRVSFGVLVTHRYIGMIGGAILKADSEAFWNAHLIAAFLGLFLTFGLLTPIALLALIFGFWTSPSSASTLGDQVAIITGWVLIFSGAGQNISFDRAVYRSIGIAKFPLRFIYGLSLAFSPANFGIIRMFAIALFWGLTYTAMSFHFFDKLWLKLEALHLFFPMPYMSNYYWVFENFRQSSPWLFDAFCRLSLLIQGLWELFLFPFMLFRIGRVFANIQGFGFFLFCAIGFNLGYLPFYETVLWLFLFAQPGTLLRHARREFAIVSWLKARTDLTPEFSESKPQLKKIAWLTPVLGLFLTFAYIAGITAYQVDRKLTGSQEIWPYIYLNYFNRIFAQHPIDVFNKADLMMGSDHFVLVRDAEGQPEVLRFLDIEGGRLQYLRNDMSYFDLSLLWQRASVEERFTGPGLDSPTDYTKNLVTRFAEWASCIEGKKTKQYTALFFRRNIEEGTFPSWSRAKFVGKYDFEINPDLLPSIFCGRSYILAPGFARSEYRRTLTHRDLKRLNLIQ